jgi:hypothetical protein
MPSNRITYNKINTPAIHYSYMAISMKELYLQKEGKCTNRRSWKLQEIKNKTVDFLL